MINRLGVGMALLIVVTILGLVVIGCAQHASTTAPAASKPATSKAAPVASTAAPSTAAPATKVIELKLSDWRPPSNMFNTDVNIPWARMIEDRSQGRVKITIYNSETLGKQADAYDMVVNDVTEIGWAGPGATPGRFPLIQVAELPLVVSDSAIGCRALEELYQTDLTALEFKEVHVLSFFTTSATQLAMTKGFVKTMEDLKGKKIGVRSDSASKAYQYLGAVPVTVGAQDAYTSLQFGTIDGTMREWEGYRALKLYEVAKYATLVGMLPTVSSLIMNQKTYDSLPADIKKIFDDLSGPWLADYVGKAIAKSDADSYTFLQNNGLNMYSLTDTERARWVAAVAPQVDAWVTLAEAKGLPGTKVLTDMRAIYDKDVKAASAASAK